MRGRHLLSIGGSIGLTLICITLVMTLPATAAMDKPNRSAGDSAPGGSLSAAGLAVNGTTTSSTLSCREGLAGWEPHLSTGIDIQALGGGVYLDFNRHAPAPQPNAMEYMQMIRINQDKDTYGNYLPSYNTSPPFSDGRLEAIIASAPGSLWLIGNEPDRGPDRPGEPGQGDTYPDVYARAYHDTYQFIKQRDPTAQVAVAGLVEVTPGRMQYWDIVWDTYATLYGTTMPVDVWNMHLYVLPEITGIGGVALGTDPSLAYLIPISHSTGVPNAYTYGDHDNLSMFDVTGAAHAAMDEGSRSRGQAAVVERVWLVVR